MDTELRRTIRSELALKGWSQADLAERIGVRPTSLSGWLMGRYQGPVDLLARIEKALRLGKGTLSTAQKIEEARDGRA